MRISQVGLGNQNHATAQAQKKRNQQDFGNELEKAQLKISNHAQKRMSARKLNLADDDYVQISKQSLSFKKGKPGVFALVQGYGTHRKRSEQDDYYGDGHERNRDCHEH